MTTDHNVAITAEMQGTIVTWEVTAGTPVRQGQVLGMLESMKLHHDIVAHTQGVLSAVAVEVGSTVKPGDVIASINASSEAREGPEEATEEVSASGPLGLDRPDLFEVVERHAIGLDEARPRAVERRRERGHRTARENVEDLIDEGSLVEYGPLVLAAQRKRRELDDLIENTPADGLVGGIASVNGDQFEGHDAQCVVMSYDYSVLAGTQGHIITGKKTDSSNSQKNCAYRWCFSPKAEVDVRVIPTPVASLGSTVMRSCGGVSCQERCRWWV